jgi:hypothetical protein
MSTKTAKELLQNTSVCGECLIWNGAAYGSKTQPTPQVYVDKHYENVRALIWNELHPNDTVLNGYGVTMTCKVPKCINPGHMVRTDEALRGNLTHIDEPPVHTHCACIDCGAPVNVPCYLGGALTKVRCKACTPSMEPGSPAAEEIVRKVAAGEITAAPSIEAAQSARNQERRKAAAAATHSRADQTSHGNGDGARLADCSATAEEGSPIGPSEPATDPHAIENLIDESRVAVTEMANTEQEPAEATTPLGPRLLEAVLFALYEAGYSYSDISSLVFFTYSLHEVRKKMEAKR